MHTDTIGYKIRLLHNQIHKRMEAKRQENEKEPLTGMPVSYTHLECSRSVHSIIC